MDRVDDPAHVVMMPCAPPKPGGLEAYAADTQSLGLFSSPRKAAAAITVTRPWIAQTPPGQTRTRWTDPQCDEAASGTVQRLASLCRDDRLVFFGADASCAG